MVVPTVPLIGPSSLDMTGKLFAPPTTVSPFYPNFQLRSSIPVAFSLQWAADDVEPQLAYSRGKWT